MTVHQHPSPCADDCAALQKFMIVSKMKTLQVAISYEIFVNKTAVSTWQLNVRYLILLNFCSAFVCLKPCFSIFSSHSPIERHQSIISLSLYHLFIISSLLNIKNRENTEPRTTAIHTDCRHGKKINNNKEMAGRKYYIISLTFQETSCLALKIE